LVGRSVDPSFEKWKGRGRGEVVKRREGAKEERKKV
jgi:hypothetical protein